MEKKPQSKREKYQGKMFTWHQIPEKVIFKIKNIYLGEIIYFSNQAGDLFSAKTIPEFVNRIRDRIAGMNEREGVRNYTAYFMKPNATEFDILYRSSETSLFIDKHIAG